jgi:tetratricopeptide (TPR) repeat protein
MGHVRDERSAAGLGRYTAHIGTLRRLVLVAFIATVVSVAVPAAQVALPATPTSNTDAPANTHIDEGFRLFFVGRYEESAAVAAALRPTWPEILTTYELRASALHFQIKREVAGTKDRKAALRACAPCAGWLTTLAAEIAEGRALARERLKKNEGDLAARFYLGKIDLTHVWLHLETLGERTGWSEYWEARKSLDAVIEREPMHARALAARAWIDYIVDTRVPFGVKWMLGGGDKKKALATVAKAAELNTADRYARAEARFALWEMLAREKRRPEAVAVARLLLAEFPENRELAKFVDGG